MAAAPILQMQAIARRHDPLVGYGMTPALGRRTFAHSVQLSIHTRLRIVFQDTLSSNIQGYAMESTTESSSMT
jgi:hypothetical protein